jgi:SAM-dependent methyltransferase
MEAQFDRSARVYDLLYAAAGKDYDTEAADLHRLVQDHRPGARTLLDVACGTGAHLARLARWYTTAGTDLSPAMLAEARRRCPGTDLVEGDMRTLDLGRRFDAVLCLFSAVGYMADAGELDQAVGRMAAHLEPRGVLVVDGWIRPAEWRDPGLLHALAAVTDGLAATRLISSRRDGARTTLEMHHLVGTRDDGIEHVVEHHRLTLFTDDEYRHAFRTAGLTVGVAPAAYPDRDRYVGTAPG